jgi:hypothetical protein
LMLILRQIVSIGEMLALRKYRQTIVVFVVTISPFKNNSIL